MYTKYFVTGATGFLGRAVTRRLLTKTADIYALVMKGEQPRTMNLRQEDLECPDPEPEEEAVEELAASAEEDN